MKDLFSKASGVGAILTGGYALYPLITDVITKGQAAFQTCAPAVAPLWLAVSALLAFLAKSPLQPKK